MMRAPLAPAADLAVHPDERDKRLPNAAAFLPPRGMQPSADARAVLVAEDHEDSRDALCTLLDALGYRVITAANGAQAVEQARAHRPDLILMDMMMPDVDGFQATRTLRADESFRGVPIVAITAMEGAREAVLQAGCDDLVSKPIDIRAFIEKVRVWVGPGRSA